VRKKAATGITQGLLLWRNYDWNQRDNPCNDSYYYGERNISKNIIASDLGLIAKRGADGNTLIFVTDLKTTKPISGVALELYDYQQQVIARLQQVQTERLSSLLKAFLLR